MPKPNRPLKVFLSYASQDKSLVRELSRRLVGEGWIDTWQDEKNLLPGQDWRVKIEEAVEEADVVIIILSQHSVSKEGHVQKELRYAREIALEKPEDSIFLIPLRLDECEVPRGLRFYQWVDYFGERKNDGYDSLIESMQLRYEQKLKQEEEASVRQEKIRKEREAAEKIVRENTEKEVAEKAWLELEEKARQRNEKIKAEHEAAEKAMREKEKRNAAEKARGERIERRTAQIVALKETLSKSLNSIRLALPKAMPFLRVGGIIGIILVLLWVGSWVVPEFFSPALTATASLTQRPIATITSLISPAPHIKTVEPSSTPTAIITFTLTPTLSRTPSPTVSPTQAKVILQCNWTTFPGIYKRVYQFCVCVNDSCECKESIFENSYLRVASEYTADRKYVDNEVKIYHGRCENK